MLGPTVAVATGILGKGTETGVRRHIRYLFGGSTVVLTERLEPGFTLDRPTLLQRGPVGPVATVERAIGTAISSRHYGCSGVPFGRDRRELEAFLAEHRVSAVVAEFGHIGANLAPVAQDLGLPVFVYFRGFDASKRLREARIVRRYRAMAPRVAGFIAVSRFLLDNLAAAGVLHPNSHVIPTGVDTEIFRPAAKDPNLILSVGRIIAKKAPMVTLEAFGRVTAAHPGARLEIVGDGDLRAEAEARMRALGLGQRVIFHGQEGHDSVRRRMAEAAIFLQHSVTDAEGNAEGLPTSIQEAMASGAAVISTNHAGIPEAVENGVTGLLVAENDVAGFAAALDALLSDPPRARALASAAREMAERDFDFRRLHARLERLIRDACADRGIAAPA